MKHFKFILVVTLIILSIINAKKRKVKSKSKDFNGDLIKTFLEQISEKSKNTAPGVYTECLKLLTEDQTNITQKREFSDYIRKKSTGDHKYLRKDLELFFGTVESKVVSDGKETLCATYFKGILKTDQVLDFTYEKIKEEVMKVLGAEPNPPASSGFVSNLATTNRGSKLINESQVLKTLNGNKAHKKRRHK